MISTLICTKFKVNDGKGIVIAPTTIEPVSPLDLNAEQEVLPISLNFMSFSLAEMGVECCLICYSVLVTIVAILYVLFDVNYFLRIAFTIGWGKLFDKKKKIHETTKIYGTLVYW